MRNSDNALYPGFNIIFSVLLKIFFCIVWKNHYSLSLVEKNPTLEMWEKIEEKGWPYCDHWQKQFCLVTGLGKGLGFLHRVKNTFSKSTEELIT